MTTETAMYSSRKKKVFIIDDEPVNGFNPDSYDDPILALEEF